MTHYTMGTVCTILGVPRHKVLYALDRGFIAEPAERINGGRVFREKDLAAMRAHFQPKKKKGKGVRS